MRHARPAAAGVAGLLLTAACLGAAPAGAATPTGPIKGSADSSLTLASLAVAGHTLSTVGLDATTSTVNSVLSRLTAVPAALDSTNFGAVTVTPSSGSRQVASQSAGLPGLASLTSPALSLAATAASTGPKALASASNLGSVSLLGLPVALTGSLTNSASTTTDAVATKTLNISGLSLPSVGALLTSLGLNLKALPISGLTSLTSGLGLGSSGLTSAVSSVTSALTGTGLNSSATLGSVTSALSTATGSLSTATSALNTALNTALPVVQSLPVVGGLLSGLPTTGLTSGLLGLTSGQQQTVTGAVPGLSSLLSTVTNAKSLLAALTNLQGALTGLTGTVTGLLGNLPLLSVGNINVTELADAGPHLAASVNGTVSGLKVLGHDVLSPLTGGSALNLTSLTGTLASSLQSTVTGLLGKLSGALSGAVPGLSLPIPQVSVLQKTATTSKTAAGDTAKASVDVLRLVIPSLHLPTALALPGVSSLPGVSTLTGALALPQIVANIGTLADTASTLTPAAATTPTVVAPAAPVTVNPATPTAAVAANAPTLAFTGLNTSVTLAGLVLLAAAGLVYRFRRAATR